MKLPITNRVETTTNRLQETDPAHAITLLLILAENALALLPEGVAEAMMDDFEAGWPVRCPKVEECA